MEERDRVGGRHLRFLPLQISSVVILCLCCSAMGPNSMSEINEDFEIQNRGDFCSFGRQHKMGFIQSCPGSCPAARISPPPPPAPACFSSHPLPPFPPKPRHTHLPKTHFDSLALYCDTRVFFLAVFGYCPRSRTICRAGQGGCGPCPAAGRLCAPPPPSRALRRRLTAGTGSPNSLLSSFLGTGGLSSVKSSWWRGNGDD